MLIFFENAQEGEDFLFIFFGNNFTYFINFGSEMQVMDQAPDPYLEL